MCGLGGAGAYSDGKLTLSTDIGGRLGERLPAKELQRLIEYVDSLYLRFGAPDEVYGIGEEVANLKRKATLAELKLMIRYFTKKLITLTLLLLLVSIAVFSVLFVLPGDPAQIMLGIHATPQTLANLRAELGLDLPFWTQYLNWLADLVTGRGSRSLNYDLPVYELIVSRLAVTGPMALLAMVFAVIISLPLGIYAARHQNRPADVSVMFFTQLGLATPEFWLGILLILLLSVELGWFSAGGFPGWAADAWGSLKALLLPAFALGVIRASILTRLTRSSMLEVLKEDYVRTARAKGLKERTVIYTTRCAMR